MLPLVSEFRTFFCASDLYRSCGTCLVAPVLLIPELLTVKCTAVIDNSYVVHSFIGMRSLTDLQALHISSSANGLL